MSRRDEPDWLRPLWVRVVLVLVVAGWCFLEWFVWKELFFGVITLAALAFAVWSLFLGRDPDT
jgi:hypothetical protein